MQRQAHCATAARSGGKYASHRELRAAANAGVSGLRQKAPIQCGFTLVELLVVISIIAVLASLILPGVMNAPGQREGLNASTT
jgi:prepilin-type N-terminal cleavage/methylation domain-containing protein